MANDALSSITDGYRCYYWGIVVSICLYGLMLSQTRTYFTASSASGKSTLRMIMRIFVAFLVLSATVTTVIQVSVVDIYLVENFGNPAALGDLRSFQLLLISLLLLTVNTFSVQAFFAYQVYSVATRAWFRIPVVVLILFIALVSWSTSIISLSIVWNNPAKIADRTIGILVGINAATATLCDLLAALSMSAMLHSARTGFKGTNDIINTLVFYTMQRGVMVTICQVLVFAAKIALPNSELWVSFDFCLGKLYVCTTLAILNAKASLRSRKFTEDTSLSTGSVVVSNLRSRGDANINERIEFAAVNPPLSNKSMKMEIMVSQEHHNGSDGESYMDRGHWKGGAI